MRMIAFWSTVSLIHYIDIVMTADIYLFFFFKFKLMSILLKKKLFITCILRNDFSVFNKITRNRK